MEEEQNHRLGRYIVKAYPNDTVRAFVPPPLPPDPPIRLDGLQQLLEQASQAVGRLDGNRVGPSRPVPVHLHLRPEGSGSVVADRRDAIVSFRSIVI